MKHMDNNPVALLQHIHSQLRNVCCVPESLTYMKELQELIDLLDSDGVTITVNLNEYLTPMTDEQISYRLRNNKLFVDNTHSS